MPKPDDTTDNNNGESTENENNSSTTPPVDETQSKPKGDSTEKTYTEAQYKGLQAVIAKRDADITNLKNRNVELEAKVAELESNHGKTVSEKTILDGKFQEAQDKVTSLEGKVAELEKQIKYKDIVMKEFPDLASAASFIPETDSDEEFREKAKELQAVLNQHVQSGVKNVLSGSSLPIEPGDENTTIGIDPVDKAYAEVVKYAGVPGKESEYMEARERYVTALQAKNEKT